MIPRIIHQIWLGGGEKPDLIKRCQDSLTKIKGYEIREWNERNYDLDQFRSAKRWHDDKVWSYCTDEMRFDLLHRFGGIYLDTDMEVLYPDALDALLHENRGIDAIVSLESCRELGTPERLGSAFIASVPGLTIWQDFVDRYELTYMNRYNRFITGPAMLTEQLLTLNRMGEMNGVMLEHDYFFPMTWEHFSTIDGCDHANVNLERYVTERTVAFHWAAMSWHRERRKAAK